ncbi:hypothetical protein BJV82DRAFT_573959 [Fennellomyces sp. T-0311]|nr:hypothetical protein BJV82DRAFT_573959 [Fennellomyces sp. T-0311]
MVSLCTNGSMPLETMLNSSTPSGQLLVSCCSIAKIFYEVRGSQMEERCKPRLQEPLHSVCNALVHHRDRWTQGILWCTLVRFPPVKRSGTGNTSKCTKISKVVSQTPVCAAPVSCKTSLYASKYLEFSKQYKAGGVRLYWGV